MKALILAIALCCACGSLPETTEINDGGNACPVPCGDFCLPAGSDCCSETQYCDVGYVCDSSSPTGCLPQGWVNSEL